MDQRVSFITLGVADLGCSRRFYEDGLGWSSGYHDDQVAFYQLNGVVLGLYAIDALTANLGLHREQVGIGGVMLTQNVGTRAAVEDAIARALVAGATVLKAAQDLPWGEYAGYIADPDGHPWEIACNPDLTLDERGNVTLPARVS